MFHTIGSLRLRNLLFLGAFLLVLVGCGGEEPTPTAVIITPSPTSIPTPDVGDNLIVSVASEPVGPGDEIGISVNVSSIAGVEIKYEWTIPEGSQILQGEESSGIILEAPSEPGRYKVGLAITSAGVVIERNVDITVEKPTDTPEPILTEPVVTDISEPPTEDASATITQTPVPEEEPTPAEKPHDQPCDNFTASTIVIRPPLDSSDLTGSITNPKHCKTELPAGSPISVGGTAEDVPDDVFLWLFAFTRNARYYPQCNDAKNGLCGANYANGRWAVTAYLGREGCKEHFHLVLVAVDSAGNDFLTRTLMSWATAGSFPGLDVSELPADITELDSIEIETVGTDEGCD